MTKEFDWEKVKVFLAEEVAGWEYEKVLVPDILQDSDTPGHKKSYNTGSGEVLFERLIPYEKFRQAKLFVPEVPDKWEEFNLNRDLETKQWVAEFIRSSTEGTGYIRKKQAHVIPCKAICLAVLKACSTDINQFRRKKNE